jgi:hypothetical protein
MAFSPKNRSCDLRFGLYPINCDDLVDRGLIDLVGLAFQSWVPRICLRKPATPIPWLCSIRCLLLYVVPCSFRHDSDISQPAHALRTASCLCTTSGVTYAYYEMFELVDMGTIIDECSYCGRLIARQNMKGKNEGPHSFCRVGRRC